MISYRVRIEREGDNFLAEFPDCPGCQTFAGTRTVAIEMAIEALTGWLESHLITGAQIPPPMYMQGPEIQIDETKLKGWKK